MKANNGHRHISEFISMLSSEIKIG